MFAALNPKAPTDVAVLHQEFGLRNYRFARPSVLRDELLVSLAKDFRDTEQMLRQGARADIAGPLYFALHLVAGLTGRVESSLSDDQILRALRSVQYATEREVVSRVVGVRDLGADEALLAALRHIARD